MGNGQASNGQASVEITAKQWNPLENIPPAKNQSGFFSTKSRYHVDRPFGSRVSYVFKSWNMKQAVAFNGRHLFSG